MKKICPRCNQPLIRTEKGMICPIHGLIEWWMLDKLDKEDIPNYVK